MENLQPLLDLLSGKVGWLPAALAWAAALRTALAFFDTRIRHFVADKLNSIGGENDVEVNAYLRNLFGKLWWKLLALVLPLPKLSDLDRAVAHQKEAVAEATPMASTHPE